MKILTMPQRSTEWFAARRGLVTASEAHKLVSPTWKVRTGEGVQTYLHEKLAEKFMGWSKSEIGFGTFATEQGNIVEQIAIPAYEFQNDVEVTRVGLCVADGDRAACSPDGLLGEDGGLEVKSPQPPAHIEYLLGGVIPPEYTVQVQFSLYVTNRKYWDFFSFHRYMPPLLVRATPIPAAQEAIAAALAQFTAAFDAAQSKLDRLTQPRGGRT